MTREKPKGRFIVAFALEVLGKQEPPETKVPILLASRVGTKAKSEACEGERERSMWGVGGLRFRN